MFIDKAMFLILGNFQIFNAEVKNIMLVVIFQGVEKECIGSKQVKANAVCLTFFICLLTDARSYQ